MFQTIRDYLAAFEGDEMILSDFLEYYTQQAEMVLSRRGGFGRT